MVRSVAYKPEACVQRERGTESENKSDWNVVVVEEELVDIGHINKTLLRN